MAKIMLEGLDAFQEKMLARAEAATAAVPKMLKAGAEIAAKAQRELAQSTITSDRTTGDLVGSIRPTQIKNKDTESYIEVYPQGNNRRGERNATVGFVREYGRSNMSARPFVAPANEQCAGAVQGAMKEEWEAMQK